jgi:hypothetical protein
LLGLARRGRRVERGREGEGEEGRGRAS